MLQSRYSRKEDHIFQILHVVNIYFKIQDLKNIDIHCSPTSKWIRWDGVGAEDGLLSSGNSHPLAWIFKGGPRFAWLKLVFSLSWVTTDPGSSLILNTGAHSGVSLACMAQPRLLGLFPLLVWPWPCILRHGWKYLDCRTGCEKIRSKLNQPRWV